MTQTNETRRAGGAAWLDNLSYLAADGSEIAPKAAGTQAENDSARITCASIRAAQLRTATKIELDRLQVKILIAKFFNREERDDDADEILRDVWRLLRSSVTPVRAVLQRLTAGADQ
jgi:hypothetical protein